MRLFQLASTVLAGRAAAFGSQLNLPQTWQLLDPPVFDAPGLLSCSYTSSGSSARNRHNQQQARKASTVATAAGRAAVPEQAVAGAGSKAVLQRSPSGPPAISFAVAVVEGVDVLQQLPDLARWVPRHGECLSE
jgi:hypothetical protein